MLARRRLSLSLSIFSLYPLFSSTLSVVLRASSPFLSSFLRNRRVGDSRRSTWQQKPSHPYSTIVLSLVFSSNPLPYTNGASRTLLFSTRIELVSASKKARRMIHCHDQSLTAPAWLCKSCQLKRSNHQRPRRVTDYASNQTERRRLSQSLP